MPRSFVHQLADFFKILGDSTRLAILQHLQTGRANVGELCESLGIVSQPAVSHHLALLKLCGVVRPTREGKNNYYSISVNSETLEAAANFLTGCEGVDGETTASKSASRPSTKAKPAVKAKAKSTKPKTKTTKTKATKSSKPKTSKPAKAKSPATKAKSAAHAARTKPRPSRVKGSRAKGEDADADEADRASEAADRASEAGESNGEFAAVENTAVENGSSTE